MIPVLWVSQVYPRNPDDMLGSFLHRLARELPERGFAVRVLAPGADGVPERETLDGVEIVRFRYAPAGKQDLAYTGEMHKQARARPARFWSFLRSFRGAVRRELTQSPPALVHAHWWVPGGWAAARPTARANVPFVLSVHGTDVRLLGKVPLSSWAAKGVFRRASAVLPVSQALADRLLEARLLNGVPTILPMPADSATFRPDGPSSSSGTPRFVLAARLTDQKRVDLAIRAVAKLAQDGLAVGLDIAGDGPELPALRSLSDELGMNDRVAFHGLVTPPDLAALFRSSVAVLLPSEQEGYGLTIVEGALCGVPAIGAESGGIADLIAPGATGLLVRPGDAVELAAAMRRLAEDSGARDEMGRAALERAGRATPGPLADRLAQLYQGLV